MRHGEFVQPFLLFETHTHTYIFLCVNASSVHVAVDLSCDSVNKGCEIYLLIFIRV